MFGKYDSGIEIELRDRIAALEVKLKNQSDIEKRLKTLEDEQGFYHPDITVMCSAGFIGFPKQKKLSIQKVLRLMIDHMGVSIVEAPAEPEKLSLVVKSKKHSIDKRK